MKVLAARVNEMHGFGNPMHLELLVDTLDHEFLYHTKVTDHGTAYYAETDGHVRFFHHSPNNENGYGGAVFHVTLIDGEKVDVRGPWSSNEDAMRDYFGIQTTSVSITDKPADFERGYTFTAAHVTNDIIKQAATLLPDYNVTPGYTGTTHKQGCKGHWFLEEENQWEPCSTHGIDCPRG